MLSESKVFLKHKVGKNIPFYIHSFKFEGKKSRLPVVKKVEKRILIGHS